MDASDAQFNWRTKSGSGRRSLRYFGQSQPCCGCLGEIEELRPTAVSLSGHSVAQHGAIKHEGVTAYPFSFRSVAMVERVLFNQLGIRR